MHIFVHINIRISFLAVFFFMLDATTIDTVYLLVDIVRATV